MPTKEMNTKGFQFFFRTGLKFGSRASLVFHVLTFVFFVSSLQINLQVMLQNKKEQLARKETRMF